MNFHSLCEILTALNLWTDIVDGETNPKIYIHDYDLGEVGPEKYDISARTEFGELIKKYEHTAVVKKYAGVTRKFITLFSTIVRGIKGSEKQVLSIVAVKKEAEGKQTIGN